MRARILAAYPDWSQRLTPPIVAVGLGAAGTLAALRLRPRWGGSAAPALAMVATLTLLTAPAVWSAVSVADGNGGAWLPAAGPTSTMGFPGGPRTVAGRGAAGGFPQTGNPGQAPASGRAGGFSAPGGSAPPGQSGQGGRIARAGQGALTFAGAEWNSLAPQLVQYLLANQGGARYLVATPTSSSASVFMLATDQPALALGGYQGWDRIITPTELAGLVRAGGVRFFLLEGTGGGFGGGQDATADLTAWVRASCAAVPAERWQTAPTSASGGTPAPGPQPGGGQSQQLYDCAGVGGSPP